MTKLADFQPSWLLHSRPQGETSALAWFFTLNEGRVNAMVKGVRNRNSRYRAQLQAFTPLEVRFRQTHKELKNLVGLETTGAAASLQGEALLCGLYANEILSRLLLPGLPAQAVFREYSIFMQLVTNAEQREPALRRLEFSLLDFLGFGISWHDAQGKNLVATTTYTWAAEQGFVALPTNAAKQNTLAPSRVFCGQDLLALAADDWRLASTRTCAKQLNRMLLAPLLGTKPLHSRQLFKQLQALRSAPKLPEQQAAS